MNPKISIVMSVFNGQEYLDEAIKSILNQTFTDFEFIIINDCSTDNSLDILNKYTNKDTRVKIINNNENKKLPKSLNIAIDNSQGKYIVRMDADDISVSNRLEIQYNYMEKNPEIAVCGSAYKTFGTTNNTWKPLLDSEMILSKLFFNSTFGHPTVIMRKSIFNSISYDENLPYAQDYMLWTQASLYGKLANIDEVLLMYRRHEQAAGIKKRQNQLDCANKVRMQMLKRLDLSPNSTEFRIHEAISENEKDFIINNFLDVQNWMEKLKLKNKEKKIVDINKFDEYIDKKTISMKPSFINKFRNKLKSVFK